MTTNKIPAKVTDSARNTTVTGTVTAITQPAEVFLHSEMRIHLDTATGPIEVGVLVANTGVDKDLDIEVGQTITAAGPVRRRDGVLAAQGWRDDAEVLHYWVLAEQTTTRGDLAAELAATHDIAEQAAGEAVTVYAEQLGAEDGDLTAEDADHVRRALEASLAHDVGAPLDAVADATTALAAARDAASGAEQDWREEIRAALAAGQRRADVADAARVSTARVDQIKAHRR